jgi:phage portal protein BeeE
VQWEQSMMDPDLTRMWARIQEGLLNLIDRAEALQQMMDRNPTTAINPSRKAMSESLDRHIAAARKEIEDIEEEMSEADKRLLYAELEELRRKRKARAT